MCLKHDSILQNLNKYIKTAKARHLCAPLDPRVSCSEEMWES